MGNDSTIRLPHAALQAAFYARRRSSGNINCSRNTSEDLVYILKEQLHFLK